MSRTPLPPSTVSRVLAAHVSPETVREVKLRALADGSSISTVVRTALVAYLDRTAVTTKEPTA